MRFRAEPLHFKRGSHTIAAEQQEEPKHGENVAETIHLLFKMTSV
jgi:hypothetical protein